MKRNITIEIKRIPVYINTMLLIIWMLKTYLILYSYYLVILICNFIVKLFEKHFLQFRFSLNIICSRKELIFFFEFLLWSKLQNKTGCLYFFKKIFLTCIYSFHGHGLVQWCEAVLLLSRSVTIIEIKCVIKTCWIFFKLKIQIS